MGLGADHVITEEMLRKPEMKDIFKVPQYWRDHLGLSLQFGAVRKGAGTVRRTNLSLDQDLAPEIEGFCCYCKGQIMDFNYTTPSCPQLNTEVEVVAPSTVPSLKGALKFGNLLNKLLQSIPKPRLALNCVGGKSTTEMLRHLQ